MSLLKLKNQQISEKDFIVYKNVIAAFGIKGVSLILSLYTMPAYMRFFGDSKVLGVWYTILSVLTWILSFDLGIGNGLRNKLSESFARGQYDAAQMYISSAYWMNGKIVLVVGIVGIALIHICDWNLIFNVSAELIEKKTLIVAMSYAFISIMLQFFLRMISSIIYALQKSALNNFISLFTTFLLLVTVWVTPNGTPEQNLKRFSFAYIICANLPMLVATVILFAGPLRQCVPRRRHVNAEKARDVISLGGIIFICQILYMVIANSNEFFIAQYTGPESVVEYQIYYRIFSLGSMIVMLALTPIWSVVSKAMAENDIAWIRRLYRRIKVLSVTGVVCEFLLIFILQPIINLWLKDSSIEVDYCTAFIFALFGSGMIYQSSLSVVTAGMGRMELQAISYGIGVLAKILIIHVGIQWTGAWVVIVLSNAMILWPYCVVQQISLNKMLKIEGVQGNVSL